MPMTSVPGTASAPQLRAHLAVPPVAPAPWPGVVVLHEAFGLNDDVRQQADRLAAAGFLAVARDLYTSGGALRCLQAVFGALHRGSGPAFDDVEAVRRWVADRADCPVVAGQGARDPRLRGEAGRLERVLTDLAVEHDVREHPRAGHSFLNRHAVGVVGQALERVVGLGYHAAQAEDAWRRILRFFDRHLRD